MPVSLRTSLRNFRANRKGNVAATFALAIAPAMLLVGAGIEYGRGEAAAARVQAALDDAILAGVNASAATRNAVVTARVTAAMAQTGLSYTLSTPEAVASTDTSYSATITAQQPLLLMSAFGTHATIARTATAQVGASASTSTTTTSVTKTNGSIATATYKGCFLTLDPHAALSFDVISANSFSVTGCSSYANTDGTGTWITGLAPYQDNSKVVAGTTSTWTTNTGQSVCILLKEPTGQGLTLNDSTVNINAPSCEINVASTGTGGSGLTSNNGPTVSVDELCVKATSNTINGTSPSALKTNCTTATDPFAGVLPAVSLPTCTVSNQTYPLNNAPNGTPVTLNPGRYCGSTNFNGTSTLTLNSGLYIISGGQWNLNGWTVNGTDVTFYFADSGSYIQMNSNTKFNVTAPTTGTYAGILMYEPTTISSKTNIPIDSGTSSAISGLIYLPSRNVTLNSTASTTAQNLTMVFNSLIMNSGTSIKIAPYSAKSITSANNNKLTKTTYYYGAWYDSSANATFSTVCSHAPYNLNVKNVVNSCATITDPFAASLPTVTPDATCYNSNLGSTAASTAVTVTMPTSGQVTLCGYVSLTGSLPAGLYIIKTPTGNTASQLTLSGATGTGVTFYVADTNATVNITGNPGLSAPTSGLYEGILLFMPNTYATQQHVTISGLSCDNGHDTSASPALAGLFYTPSWNVTLHSWSSCYVAGTWVANAVDMDSFSSVTWGPSARTIYVDGSGNADYSYKTTLTTTTTVSNTGSSTIYLSQ